MSMVDSATIEPVNVSGTSFIFVVGNWVTSNLFTFSTIGSRELVDTGFGVSVDVGLVLAETTGLEITFFIQINFFPLF